MSPLSFFRSIYTLDTLDTRFSTPSTASYRTVIDSRADPLAKDEQKERIASRASPSKWKTPEFFLYYLVFAICVPLMCWIPYTVSRRMRFLNPEREGSFILKMLTCSWRSLRPKISQLRTMAEPRLGARSQDGEPRYTHPSVTG